MPDIDTLKGLGEFFQQYGGWGVAIFLAIGIGYLHKSMSNLLENRNTQLVGLLAECKSVVAENKVFMDRVEDTIEESSDGIKENTALIIECKAAINRNLEVLDRVRILLEIQSRRLP